MRIVFVVENRFKSEFGFWTIKMACIREFKQEEGPKCKSSRLNQIKNQTAFESFSSSQRKRSMPQSQTSLRPILQAKWLDPKSVCL